MSFICSFSELRRAVRKLRRLQTACRQSDHWWEVDRRYTTDYFSYDEELGRWQKEIARYAAYVRTTGRTAVHLDVCGNTTATSMGFDHSYQLSMSQHHSLTSKDATAIRLDIFERTSLRTVLAEIVDECGELTLTTFRPWSGLGAFTPKMNDMDTYKALVYRRLFDQLTLVVAATRVGGYIHLEHPFQLEEGIRNFFQRTDPKKFLSHLTLKAWARKHDCSIRYHYDEFGHKWLLRKDYKKLGPIP